MELSVGGLGNLHLSLFFPLTTCPFFAANISCEASLLLLLVEVSPLHISDEESDCKDEFDRLFGGFLSVVEEEFAISTST